MHEVFLLFKTLWIWFNAAHISYKSSTRLDSRQAARRQISPLRKPRNAPWLYLVITLPSMLKARSAPGARADQSCAKVGARGAGGHLLVCLGNTQTSH